MVRLSDSPRSTPALRVLVVTAMYPHRAKPAHGVFIQQQVDSLRARGHQVDVLHFRGYRSSLLYLLAAARVIWKTISTPYDVVHAHFGLTGLASLVRWRVPLVLTLHGSDVLGKRFQRLASKIAARGARRVIAVSPEISQVIAGDVIPCGVDMDRFVPLERSRARGQLGLSMGPRLILFPFDPARTEKRYDLARAAVDELRRRLPNAELWVVHDIANLEMPIHYAAADALLLTSDREGSSTSIKEALACNIPVVTTAVGDASILLGDQPAHRISKADSISLADSLLAVIERGRLNDSESRDLVRKYSMGAVAAAIEGIYFTVAAARR